MQPLTRALVCRAVDIYGLAWTGQDSSLIASLFAEDAVYVERVFDASATMRGRAAIRAYWDRQICGKQSGIAFRHAQVRGVSLSLLLLCFELFLLLLLLPSSFFFFSVFFSSSFFFLLLLLLFLILLVSHHALTFPAPSRPPTTPSYSDGT
jgi:hypothetical protein